MKMENFQVVLFSFLYVSSFVFHFYFFLESTDEQLELWENSLQALESIILRCPNKVTTYIPNIVKLSMALSTYDPMYSYDEMEGNKQKQTIWEIRIVLTYLYIYICYLCRC
jgi:hypothetical protein